jgi:xanthine dehydrogenase YagS FAD-binding subunit
MKNFSYYRPSTAEQAIALLDAKWGKTELLAGGTDLLDLQKEYIAQPEKVVSLSGLNKDRAFSGSTIADSDPPIITLGAGMKLAEIAEFRELHKYCPALTAAADDIGGPQIRNMGTLGGNLCQRNRCWYFRDEHVSCLIKGGEKCFAKNGENRYHAVFGTDRPCVIVHPSTLAPVLIALDAVAEVKGPKGDRQIKLAEFFQLPKSTGEREHVVEPNEMVWSVTIRCKRDWKNGSYEVRQKQSYDWPLVQAAVAYQLDGGKAKNVRVVLGHVAATPHVAEGAAKAMEGKEITDETAAAASEAACEGAKPLSQNAYKVKLIAVAVKRAFLTAAGAKKYWEV